MTSRDLVTELRSTMDQLSLGVPSAFAPVRQGSDNALGVPEFEGEVDVVDLTEPPVRGRAFAVRTDPPRSRRAEIDLGEEVGGYRRWWTVRSLQAMRHGNERR